MIITKMKVEEPCVLILFKKKFKRGTAPIGWCKTCVALARVQSRGLEGRKQERKCRGGMIYHVETIIVQYFIDEEIESVGGGVALRSLASGRSCVLKTPQAQPFAPLRGRASGR